MLRRWRVPLIVFLFVVVATAVFLFWQSRTQAAGPAFAYCPGPDLYGYTCTGGEGIAYIDATNDTFLYEDDSTVQLDLPFPFTFYGTTYTQVNVSSNGNLQFDSDNPFFFNDCLADGPIAGMGDMIAPYWDDLDLLYEGYLQYELIGEMPHRVFVIEWDDVPRFGIESDDRVTFEVQLFEDSNDIAFLYADVTTLGGANGRDATIGLQSESNQITLQYSCNQASVSDTSKLFFPHPENPNRSVGSDSIFNQPSSVNLPLAKGHVADLLTRLNQQGTAVLPQMRQDWLNQRIPRTSEWLLVDLDGNGRSELLVIWHSTAQHPQATQLALFHSQDEAEGDWILAFDQRLSTRELAITDLTILETVELTHDDLPDVLLTDGDNGRYWLLTHTLDGLLLTAIPDQCHGNWIATDTNQDGLIDFVRDGCQSGDGRVSYTFTQDDWLPSTP